MVGHLLLAGLEFYDCQVELEGTALPVSINDMSLPLGGYFDLRANWDCDVANPTHRFHRIGFSVDINKNGILKCDSQGKHCVLTRKGYLLIDAMKDHHGEINNEQNRVHFGFLQRQ